MVSDTVSIYVTTGISAAESRKIFFLMTRINKCFRDAFEMGVIRIYLYIKPKITLLFMSLGF